MGRRCSRLPPAVAKRVRLSTSMAPTPLRTHGGKPETDMGRCAPCLPRSPARPGNFVASAHPTRSKGPLLCSKTSNGSYTPSSPTAQYEMNTQYGVFVLATGGLATQALLLVRRVVEDWLAWWYLQVRPEQAVRFHDFEEKSPGWNEMVQALGNPPPDWPSDYQVRQWRKSLNELIKRLTTRLGERAL